MISKLSVNMRTPFPRIVPSTLSDTAFFLGPDVVSADDPDMSETRTNPADLMVSIRAGASVD